jgi:hypothetical protein
MVVLWGDEGWAGQEVIFPAGRDSDADETPSATVYAAYYKALEEVVVLANAHLLVLEEMRDNFKREWKGVRKERTKKRAMVLEARGGIGEVGGEVRR